MSAIPPSNEMEEKLRKKWSRTGGIFKQPVRMWKGMQLKESLGPCKSEPRWIPVYIHHAGRNQDVWQWQAWKRWVEKFSLTLARQNDLCKKRCLVSAHTCRLLSGVGALGCAEEAAPSFPVSLIALNWKLLQYLLTSHWINKLGHIRTKKNYTLIKMSKLQLWMNPLNSKAVYITLFVGNLKNRHK